MMYHAPTVRVIFGHALKPTANKFKALSGGLVMGRCEGVTAPHICAIPIFAIIE
jgi:hypothetical protein